MVYNICFELASVVFVTILCIYHELQYSSRLEVNREFKKMAWIILAATCMDIVTAITISYSAQIPDIVNIILNTAYFEIDVLVGFFFLRYVCTYIYTKGQHKKLIIANNILHCICLCLLLINIATGWVFSFDEGRYIHGPLYVVVYIIPIYYILFADGILIKNWRMFQRKQQASIICFSSMIIGGALVQMLLLPDVLLALFSTSVGLVIIHYSLETPDYQRLVKTMDELEAAKNEAQKANRAKGEFLANMSHELRTPINAIMGFNELIMNETGESHIAEYALKVQSSGHTLISIVNDILDFTKIDNGTLKLEKKPYSTLSLLQDSAIYAKCFAEKKGLECRITIDESLPRELSGDSVRLSQIMNNLISNAVKYTQQGYIEFAVSWRVSETEEKSGSLGIRVSDSGIGMHPEDVEKLTNEESFFTRFDNRNTRNIQGIGLGLTTVKRLLALMESRLEVESEYGKGSSFYFEVKQEISNPAGISKVWDTADAPVADVGKDLVYLPDAVILAADDNVMNLDMLKGLLKHTKIHIDTASNGEEALKMMEKKHYNLVLLDHMMPVMDGVETLHEMKRRNLCQGTPVIALTANAVAGARESYLAEGFEDYLSKPIKGAELERLMQKYIPAELQVREEKKAAARTHNSGFLSKLAFLDTNTAMIYCCNSEEFYREMLSSYLENNRSEELDSYYLQKNWENYRIAVHALKSTSLSIGAVSLSEQAKAMEKAAKDNDISFLTENHQKLSEDYRQLLAQIDSVLNGSGDSCVNQITVQVQEENVPSIFAVDDDMMNLRIIEHMLEGQFSVTVFNSGEKLFNALQKEIPQMILLDVMMPEMDGFEVLRRLKENKAYQGIPVIFLTADEDKDTEIKGFEQGVLDFIRKPFSAEIMIQRIRRILQLDYLQKRLQVEVDKRTSEVIEQKRKVEHLTIEVIQTLSGAIDAKDKYTNGHSRRVAEYAQAIARRLGKSEKEINDIYFTGILHDVGKIGVPVEIINKTARLTDEEYAIIKTHPAIGANILSSISEIPDIAIGAHWHHERYDGRGYPDGLKGTEIPEMARIIGVADAYDAMTSKRSYRGVLPQEVVHGELVKGKGTQFDPVFADIMLSLMDEDVDYQMREF